MHKHKKVWKCKAMPMQFDRTTYTSDRDDELRNRLNHLQYVAYLKSTSDADRGRSGQHGVSKRSNGRWQSRITGIAVCLPAADFISFRDPYCHISQRLLELCNLFDRNMAPDVISSWLFINLQCEVMIPKSGGRKRRNHFLIENSHASEEASQ